MKKSVKIILAIIITIAIGVGGGIGINCAYNKDRYTPLQYCYHEVASNYEGGRVPYSYKEIHSSREDKPAHLYYYDYEITVYDEDKMDVWYCSICFYSSVGEKTRYKGEEGKWIDCDLAYSVSYGR